MDVGLERVIGVKVDPFLGVGGVQAVVAGELDGGGDRHGGYVESVTLKKNLKLDKGYDYKKLSRKSKDTFTLVK